MLVPVAPGSSPGTSLACSSFHHDLECLLVLLCVCVCTGSVHLQLT